MTCRFAFAFAAVPHFVTADLESGRISTRDLAVLNVLLTLAHDGSISGLTDAQLARRCNIAVATFKRALRSLRAAGRIVCAKVRSAFRRVINIPWLRPSAPAETLTQINREDHQRSPERITSDPPRGSPAIPRADSPLEPPL